MSTNRSRLSNDSEYLARREAQERLAAEQSTDLTARRAHESLAEQYAEQLRATPPAAG